MATLLLIIICIAYIGLGIPDSLFGTVWPAVYPDFGIPVSYASFITTLISCGTILSSLLSARLIRRFGTAKVAAFSTALTAGALLGFSLSQNLIWMCLFSVPLGLGAGSVDTGLNNYVALHYKASHMSYLHCFYGVGVTVSPWILSFALRDNGWRQGYGIMFCIQLAIAFIMFSSLPLWKKIQEKQPEEEAATVVSIPRMLKLPSVGFTLLVFLGSCAIEAVTLGYGSTFLTRHHRLSPADAAQIITFYYFGLALGRFLSGILAGKLSPKKIILLGEGITFLAILLTLLPLGPVWAGVGLFLVGLGNGPVFPNMTHLTPIHFGREISQSIIGLQMTVANTSFLTAPVITGLILQHLGAGYFPWILLAAFLVTSTATALLLNFHKRSDPL